MLSIDRVFFLLESEFFFFFQAEDGIRDLVRSRGLGDVYKETGPILLLQMFGLVWAKNPK